MGSEHNTGTLSRSLGTRLSWSAWAWALGLLALLACSETPPSAGRTTPEEVIDGTQWVALARAEDPFVTLLPDAVTDCVVAGVDTSDGLLDLDTGACGFISATTPLTGTIHEGEQVKIILWHLALYADPPAQGTFLVHIGDTEVARVVVDIPKLEQVYQPVFTAPKTWPKGTPVRAHVHNHGANTWKLYTVTAGG